MKWSSNEYQPDNDDNTLWRDAVNMGFVKPACGEREILSQYYLGVCGFVCVLSVRPNICSLELIIYVWISK